MSTHNIINQLSLFYNRPIWQSVRMCVVGGGRELSGVGALTISICRRVCNGVRGGHGGDGPGFGASLALGTSCGQSSNSLGELHWLPVKYRIIFKVVLLTFKALHALAPNYLRTLLQSYIPSRSLRSGTGNLLIMPKARRKLGCQSFAVAAPKLWNDLPVNIRTTTSIVSFRSSLKTRLFKLAYA